MSMSVVTTPQNAHLGQTSATTSNPCNLLQFGGYIISQAGIARLGSRFTNPPYTFPASASAVAAHEVYKKLKELNLAGLLNVGTSQNPRWIVSTKNKVLPYRDRVHERDLAPLQVNKWDKWTLKVLIEELYVDPSEVTGFKSVLCNDMPHDPDVFGEMSRSQMEAWWAECSKN